MKRTRHALALLLPLLGTSTPVSAQEPPTAFVDCTVVPMDVPRRLEHHTVVVRDGVLQAVGPNDEVEVPANARRIDATGRFLMPGLADMHTHLRSNASYLDLNLANGVTTILELSGSPEYLGWREEIRHGEREGPTLYVSALFDGPQVGREPYQIVRNADEARARVRSAKEAGFDLIKVYSFLGAEPSRP
jgi:predicted amidohydrolase